MNGLNDDFDRELLNIQAFSFVRDQAIFLLSLDGIIRSWNLGVESILGYQEEEFLGMTGAAIFTPEDRLAGAVEREQALAVAEGWANDERWHLKKTGSRFWANGSMTPVLNQAGELIGFIKLLRDATISRLRTEELRASEERFRLIVETANEAIVILNEDGTIRFCNSHFSEIISEPAGEIIGKKFANYIRETDPGVVERCFQSGSNCGYERHEICLKPGNSNERRWVLASLSPLKVNDNAVLCFLTDITEARQTADVVRLSEAKFRALVENSTGSITLISPGKEILYTSPALSRDLGYDPDELAQVGKLNLLHPADRDSVMEGLDRLISTPGHSITKEYRLRRADGSYGWREGVATNLINDPAVQAIVVNSRDITEKKLAEQMAQEALALVRQEKLSAEEASLEKNAYLGSMSHEIRTPLNVIIGYAELLLEDDHERLPDSFRRDLERIVTAGRHLLDLVTGILDLTKIEAGKMELQLEDVDVGELVRVVSDTSESLMAKGHNRLDVELPDRPVIVRSDRTKLRQILLNLLSNASKFTDNGTITIQVLPLSVAGQDWVRLQVSDTGRGLSRQQMATLFEPYKSAPGAVNRQVGTGLGLVLTRRFCQLLSGDLTVESTPGKGSTFIVSIPRSV